MQESGPRCSNPPENGYETYDSTVKVYRDSAEIVSIARL